MIRKLKLRNPFILAPMHQINDPAFRELCKINGCGLAYTWLLNPRTKEKIRLDDHPAVQIATPSEKGVGDFVKKHDKKAFSFDLNLGCPVIKAKEQDYGAYLQKKPETVENILKLMRKSTKKPITVKIRKSPQVMKLIKIFEKYCDAIAIHPRTAKQGYSGIPDIRFAESFKKKTKLPVIYSGDVDEKNAIELLKKFDYVMIGRKAIGNPAIFAALTGTRPRNSFKEYLKLAKTCKIGFSQMKFQALNFTKGRSNSKKVRVRLSTAKNLKELKKIMSELD